MTMSQNPIPYVPIHAVERFVERFPSDAADKTPAEIRQIILAAWDAGVPWGATTGDGETRLSTLPSGAQCVIPVARSLKFENLTVRTVLTYEHAMANQQATYRGKWQHARSSRPNRRRE